MAMRGMGTILQAEIASVYTNIFERVRVKPPPFTRDTIDTTHMDSPNNIKEFIASLGEEGECELSVQYTPTNATHKHILSLKTSMATSNWKLIFADASPWGPFAAILTGFDVDEILPDGKVTAAVKLKVSGLVTTPA